LGIWNWQFPGGLSERIATGENAQMRRINGRMIKICDSPMTQLDQMPQGHSRSACVIRNDLRAMPSYNAVEADIRNAAAVEHFRSATLVGPTATTPSTRSGGSWNGP